MFSIFASLYSILRAIPDTYYCTMFDEASYRCSCFLNARRRWCGLRNDLFVVLDNVVVVLVLGKLFQVPQKKCTFTNCK